MIQKESTFIELICPESKFAFDLITNFISETQSNLQQTKRAVLACCKRKQNSQHIISTEFSYRFSRPGGEVYKKFCVQGEVPDSQHSTLLNKSKHKVQR